MQHEPRGNGSRRRSDTPASRRSLLAGSLIDPQFSEPLALGEYAEEWFRSYNGRTSRGLSDGTRTDYRRSLQIHVLPVLGDHLLDRITPRDVRAVVSGLENAGHAPSSVRKHIAALKVLLSTAVEDGLLAQSPASPVRIASRRPGWEPKEIRALTVGELRALFDELPRSAQPLFKLLVETGLRIGETLELRWSDVVLGDRPYLRVRRQFARGTVRPPKSRYGRRDIPLSYGMVVALKAIRENREGAGSDLVFSSRNGGHLDVSNLRTRILKPAAARAGLPWVGLHTFRHTCASLLIVSGKDLKQVQRWLGHHDAAFTLNTYVHLLDAGLGDAQCFDALGL